MYFIFTFLKSPFSVTTGGGLKFGTLTEHIAVPDNGAKRVTIRMLP